MRTVGPITLTLGVPVTEDDPAQLGGNPSQYVQVQNSSPFVLNVLTIGDVYTIQPRIAQTMPVSGQPIIITPTQQLAGGTTTITLVWLLEGEIPPMQDGPLPSASNVVPVAGEVDQLFPPTSLSFTTTTQTSVLPASFNAYETVLVALTAGSSAAPIPVAVQIVVSTPQGSIYSAWQSTVLIEDVSGDEYTGPLFFPVPVRFGDFVVLNYRSLLYGGTAQVAVSVYGLGAPLQPSPLRGDGRLMPVNTLSSSATVSSASATLVVAPPAGVSILLSSLTMLSGGSTGNATVNATLNGAGIVLAQAANIVSVSNMIPPAGLRLDPATNVVLTWFAGSVAAFALYDFVV
jgi:hypothetical protein